MNVGSFTVKNNLPVKSSDQFFSSILIFCIKHQNCKIRAIVLSYQHYDFNLHAEKIPTGIHLIFRINL